MGCHQRLQGAFHRADARQEVIASGSVRADDPHADFRRELLQKFAEGIPGNRPGLGNVLDNDLRNRPVAFGNDRSAARPDRLEAIYQRQRYGRQAKAEKYSRRNAPVAHGGHLLA
jgi:hypothetical protein